MSITLQYSGVLGGDKSVSGSSPGTTLGCVQTILGKYIQSNSIKSLPDHNTEFLLNYSKARAKSPWKANL